MDDTATSRLYTTQRPRIQTKRYAKVAHGIRGALHSLKARPTLWFGRRRVGRLDRVWMERLGARVRTDPVFTSQPCRARNVSRGPPPTGQHSEFSAPSFHPLVKSIPGRVDSRLHQYILVLYIFLWRHHPTQARPFPSATANCTTGRPVSAPETGLSACTSAYWETLQQLSSSMCFSLLPVDKPQAKSPGPIRPLLRSATQRARQTAR